MKPLADITMIIEGSYPYVAGGVASWCHQIITGLPEFTFELVVLQASEKEQRKLKYPLPANVQKIHHIPLNRKIKKPLLLPAKLSCLSIILEWFSDNLSIQGFERLSNFFFTHKNPDKLLEEIVYSRQGYEHLEKFFHDLKLGGKSYLNYFWLMRSLCLSYTNVLHARIPPARIFHTVSTGYAGMMCAHLKTCYPKSKALITEHGIYTRERSMEVAVSKWPDQDFDAFRPEEGGGFYKKLWTKSFQLMSTLSYHYCDPIISLYEKNNQIQIREGADPQKTFTIRNGIDLSTYSFRHRKNVQNPVKIGFLGRIVPIKDIKTLIRAAAIVIQRFPESILIVAGPSEEAEDYMKECKTLVSMLGLTQKVLFPGKVNAKQFLDEIDIMILTSLSEGQPLVILEANAVGVPCIAPDVGGCREIIYGGSDDPYHASGLITLQANPASTANAILKLIEDSAYYSECSVAGRKRVEAFYSQELLLDKYREVYQLLLDQSWQELDLN